MNIAGVTNEDGLMCAQLIQIIQKARFDNMNSQDAESLLRCKKWVHDLAMEMAKSLKTGQAPATPAPATSGFQSMKIKNMGSLGISKKSVIKKKSK